MDDARAVYARSALKNLPRLLSLLDRNPLSPSYGCFHRDYWLYKTSDFPDAVRQFAVHALALAYTSDFSQVSGVSGQGSQYYQNPNVCDWAIAALNFWAGIQHADGSFDEFYPYERGWVGPTAFTTYASSEAFRLLRSKIPPETAQRVAAAIRRAARFIAAGEHEEDHLANHHAMAVLAVATAADVLGDAELWAAVPRLWHGFLRYHDAEGWSREYDGADPGYLSATVSFLAKTYAGIKNQELRITGEIRQVLQAAVEFCSYFVYPDGSYGGTIGSRNTLHFYPHGLELLSAEMPLAASVAERMAAALAHGNLVPPESMSDRYVHYRVPEYLLAARDARPRPVILAQLPYERPPFVRHFEHAGVVAAVHGPAYTVANLAKGGVIKSFQRELGTLTASDGGWAGELTDGTLVSSQWIDPENRSAVPPFTVLRKTVNAEAAAHVVGDDPTRLTFAVSGRLHRIPPLKLFTLWTHLLFRLTLGLLGWSPRAAHWLKGRIRTSLILGARPTSATFRRTVYLTDEHIEIADELRNPSRLQFRRLLLGGEVPLRYVPQSRFFQPQELSSAPTALTSEELASVNRGEPFRRVRTIPLVSPRAEPVEVQRAESFVAIS